MPKYDMFIASGLEERLIRISEVTENDELSCGMTDFLAAQIGKLLMISRSWFAWSIYRGGRVIPYTVYVADYKAWLRTGDMSEHIIWW